MTSFILKRSFTCQSEFIPTKFNKIRFFRSTKTREKLYMFDKPVEELQEELSDEERAGTSKEQEDEDTKKRDEPTQFKWKVKRRCDGTRYVVKRPIRSQILKKREAQLLRERTGLSTDDDALSELKVINELLELLKRDISAGPLPFERRTKTAHGQREKEEGKDTAKDPRSSACRHGKVKEFSYAGYFRQLWSYRIKRCRKKPIRCFWMVL